MIGTVAVPEAVMTVAMNATGPRDAKCIEPFRCFGIVDYSIVEKLALSTEYWVCTENWQIVSRISESTPSSHSNVTLVSNSAVGPALLLSTTMWVSDQTFLYLYFAQTMCELGYKTDNYPSAILDRIFFPRRESKLVVLRVYALCLPTIRIQFRKLEVPVILAERAKTTMTNLLALRRSRVVFHFIFAWWHCFALSFIGLNCISAWLKL